MKPEKRKIDNLEFRCHVPNLLGEILNNKSCGILKIPLNVFGRLLMKVAVRASQLDDAILNKLMCQLTLYEVANPESKEYDREKLAFHLKKT